MQIPSRKQIIRDAVLQSRREGGALVTKVFNKGKFLQGTKLSKVSPLMGLVPSHFIIDVAEVEKNMVSEIVKLLATCPPEDEKVLVISHAISDLNSRTVVTMRKQDMDHLRKITKKSR